MHLLVVGAGSIGQRHAKNLTALGHAVSLVDVDKTRKPNFFSITEALAKEPFDMAFICSPSRFHIEQAIECGKQGLHLFVEKPLSDSMDGIAELLEIVQKKKLITMVGSNWKFYPSFQKMKELLDAGVIGTIFSARCAFGQYLPDWHPEEDYRSGYSANKKLGGGILLDSHEFDYLTWFIDKPVRGIFCMADKVSDLDIDVEDIAEVVLQFEGGAIAEIHLDYLQRVYQRSFEFVGSEGTMHWDIHEKNVAVLKKNAEIKHYPLVEPYDLNAMYIEEVRHFLTCVKEKKETIMPIAKGSDILRLIMAAKESAKTGKRIHFV